MLLLTGQSGFCDDNSCDRVKLFMEQLHMLWGHAIHEVGSKPLIRSVYGVVVTTQGTCSG